MVQIFLRLTSGKEKKKKYDKNDRQIDNLSHKIKKKKVIYLYVVVWVINISCLEEKENLRKTITLWTLVKVFLYLKKVYTFLYTPSIIIILSITSINEKQCFTFTMKT